MSAASLAAQAPSPRPQAPLRVVILSTYYHPVVGGVESHARQLATSLRERAVDVWVLTKRIGPETPAREEIDGVRIERVLPDGPREPTAKWRMVPHAVRALLRAREQFDVIVCPDFRGIGLAALVAGRWLRKPVVFQSATPGALSCDHWDDTLARYGIRAASWASRAIKWPAQFLYGRADAFACISDEIRQEVSRIAPDAEAIYLPYAIDVGAYRPPSASERADARARLGLADADRAVAFVGRLSREKGVLDLLEAWKQVTYEPAVLLVVGPDMTGHALDAGPAARALAATMPPGRVRFCGGTTDVRGYLAAADVFAQPSHYEAFGLSVVEAMASGRPIVATAVGGMREFLDDGRNALLCAPQDPRGLARALEALLFQPSLAAAIAAEARQTVERRFEKQLITDRWLTLLTRVARGGAVVRGRLAF